MEKLKILNISDNLPLIKQNYKAYIEVKGKDDFDSFNKRKIMYKNWTSILCDTYNSLLKYYKNDTNEYWQKIKSFVLKKCKYVEVEITIEEVLKKYRNKKVHSENPNCIENNLLPFIVSDTELEELQILLVDTINYEMGKIDKCQIFTHLIKEGSNLIAYKNFINSITESFKQATSKEKEMIEIPYSIMQNILNILIDDSILTEEIIDKIEDDLDIADDIINSSEFKAAMLEQPNGQDVLDFFVKIRNSESEQCFYEACIEFKNKILGNK